MFFSRPKGSSINHVVYLFGYSPKLLLPPTPPTFCALFYHSEFLSFPFDLKGACLVRWRWVLWFWGQLADQRAVAPWKWGRTDWTWGLLEKKSLGSLYILLIYVSCSWYHWFSILLSYFISLNWISVALQWLAKGFTLCTSFRMLRGSTLQHHLQRKQWGYLWIRANMISKFHSHKSALRDSAK